LPGPNLECRPKNLGWTERQSIWSGLEDRLICKTMNRFSIRFKIQLSLIILSTLALLCYLMVAKNVFERDKTATIFDLNLKESKFKAMALNARLLSLVSVAHSLIETYDFRRQKASEMGGQLFRRSPEIRALQVRSAKKTNSPLLTLERERGLFEDSGVQKAIGKLLLSSEVLALEVLEPQQGLFLLGFKVTDSKRPREDLRAWMMIQLPEWVEALQSQGANTELLLTAGNQFWQIGGKSKAMSSALEAALKNKNLLLGPDQAFTLSWEGQRDLVTSARFSNLKLAIVSVTDREMVFAGFNSIYVKSFIFFGVMMGFVILISTVVARSVTVNLEKLKQTTETVAAGQFDVEIKLDSKDEVGVLAIAFQRMINEIRRLLRETVEKTRMEGELKMARAVQETLFPPPRVQLEKILIHGSYESASECGGDWWYYQIKGDDVFLIVADATGHGASAALITSAARSAFSVVMQREKLTITDLAQLLNRAIFESSKGEILMTAMLLKLDIRTGAFSYVNASHEPALVVNPRALAGPKLEPQYLMEQISPRLGFSVTEHFFEHQGQLKEGDIMILYTDGLLDIQAPAGQAFGERRMNRSLLAGLQQEGASGDKILKRLVDDAQRYRAGTTLVDDVTLVVMEFGAGRS
jgi:phosphoserine phosphatase RsbU/P